MKRLITLAASLLLLLVLAFPAWATVTVVNNNGCLTVTLDGTGSFDWNTAVITGGTGVGVPVRNYFTNGLRVTKITGKGSAGADIIIRDGSTTGPFVPPGMGTVSGDKAVLYYTDGRWYKPCIVHTDCTTDTGYQVGFYYNN